jgi:hypothetical protein
VVTKKKPTRKVPSKKAAFLAAFAECGRVSAAARSAKVTRAMHYRWLEEDPDYPAAFDRAQEQAAQAWEDEAVRRAVDGIFEPTTYKGQFVFPVIGFEKHPETGEPIFSKPIYGKKPFGLVKHSDRLLEFLLRGARPDKYRDRGSVELTGADGGPVEIVARLTAARARLQPAAPSPAAETPEASGE